MKVERNPGPGSWLPALSRLPANFVVGVLRVYRRYVSPCLGPHCRFHPTCSSYALQAITRHGLAMGSWLALRRLLRCHPLNPGGFDPVPDAARGEPAGGRTDHHAAT